MKRYEDLLDTTFHKVVIEPIRKGYFAESVGQYVSLYNPEFHYSENKHHKLTSKEAKGLIAKHLTRMEYV